MVASSTEKSQPVYGGRQRGSNCCSYQFVSSEAVIVLLTDTYATHVVCSLKEDLLQGE